MGRLEKQLLKQILDIRKEIMDLEKSIISTEKKIETLKKSEVCDTVTGSRSDLTIGPIKIRGNPQKDYGRRLRELQKKKTLMEDKKTELLQAEREAEEYIQSIQDSSLRRIMRYRYMDGMGWQQVAVRMGKRYTADSCRMMHNRFMSG